MMQRIFTMIFTAALLFLGGSWIYAQTTPTGTNTTQGSGSGGGSGGLSVVDSAAWTAATSNFTPTGGEYNPGAAALTSGQQGTIALTAARSMHVLDDNSASLLTAAQSAVPCLNATTATTNSYTTGQTNPVNCNLNGAPYVAVTNTVTTATAAADPCQANAHVYKPLAIATGTTTNVITGTSAKKLYICQIILTTGIANNVTVIEGTTGGTCGSGTAGIFGGTTTGTGFVFPANGGVSIGMGGYAVAQTATNANDICIITSASGPLAGGITYVVQ